MTILKKTSKITASITMALLIGITIIIASCTKEDVPNDDAIFKSACINPYDIFGEYHNEAMQIIFDSATAGKPLNLPVFVCDFTAKKLSSNSKYDYRFWMERLVPCMDFINGQFIPSYTSLQSIDFSNPFYNSLTDYQRKYLDKVFKRIESANNEQEYYNSLQLIEKEVLKNKGIPEWEAGLILGTISIAKYSFEFAIQHFPNKKAPRWLERVKNVAKADAVGFVAGAVGSVINGHAAAATMTFGPQGTVVVVAGEATVGAITSSGVAVIGEIMNH